MKGDDIDLATLASLLDSRTASDLSSSIAAIAHSMEFEHWVYARELPLVETTHEPMILGGYPPDWVEHYFSRGYLRIDPVILHCTQHVTPFVWPGRVPQKGTLRAFFGEAREFGLMSGITVPLHGPGASWGLLSLASADSDQAHLDSVTSRAMVLSSFVHEAVRNIDLRGSLKRSPPLTQRELECLSWAAAGKGSWEIGRLLGVSERTVVFHLHNASTKLGVSTRLAAVARAISLGLINP